MAAVGEGRGTKRQKESTGEGSDVKVLNGNKSRPRVDNKRLTGVSPGLWVPSQVARPRGDVGPCRGPWIGSPQSSSVFSVDGEVLVKPNCRSRSVSDEY